MIRPPPRSTRTDPLSPYTPLSRSVCRPESRVPALLRQRGTEPRQLGTNRAIDDHVAGSDYRAADQCRVERGFNRHVAAKTPGQRLPDLLDLRVIQRSGGSHGSLHHAILLGRSEEHTSELQSLMRISYAVFCLKKKTKI